MTHQIAGDSAGPEGLFESLLQPDIGPGRGMEIAMDREYAFLFDHDTDDDQRIGNVVSWIEYRDEYFDQLSAWNQSLAKQLVASPVQLRTPLRAITARLIENIQETCTARLLYHRIAELEDQVKRIPDLYLRITQIEEYLSQGRQVGTVDRAVAETAARDMVRIAKDFWGRQLVRTDTTWEDDPVTGYRQLTVSFTVSEERERLRVRKRTFSEHLRSNIREDLFENLLVVVRRYA